MARFNIPISASQLGDNIVVTGSANTPTIQIVELVFHVSAASTVTLKGGSSPLTGAMCFATGGELQLPNNGQAPHFEVDNGADFIINLSGILGSVGGYVVYDQF